MSKEEKQRDELMNFVEFLLSQGKILQDIQTNSLDTAIVKCNGNEHYVPKEAENLIDILETIDFLLERTNIMVNLIKENLTMTIIVCEDKEYEHNKGVK